MSEKSLTLKEYQRQYYLKNKEKYLTRAKKQRERLKVEKKKKENKKELEIIEQQERPTFLRPLLVRCFRCKNWFLIKYVPWKKRFSLKNNWDWWTKKEEEKGKKICDACLKDLYLNHKVEYRQNIWDGERRVVLRNYVT